MHDRSTTTPPERRRWVSADALIRWAEARRDPDRVVTAKDAAQARERAGTARRAGGGGA